MFLVRSAIAVLLCSSAAPLAAQEVQVAAAPPAEDASNDIVVMGEKANRTLQDTPASVAVTTAETIVEQNLIDVYDVLERTPNVAIGANRNSFTIRGIDAFNVSGAGDGALASVYVDGAVLPRAALNNGPLDLYDIAQVEVFRGPQSTVQGRNALAGAVIVRTTDPGFDWSGRARLMMTDADGQRRAAGAHRGLPAERGEFGKVGGDDRSLPHQPRERRDRVGIGEHRSAGCDHDGVEHDRHRKGIEHVRHGTCGGGRSDHADLHRIDAKIVDYRAHLRNDDIRGYRVDRLHAERVLRGDRGDRGHGMAAEHRDGPDVRLDTRAAARIGPGNDEDAGDHDAGRDSGARGLRFMGPVMASCGRAGQTVC